MKRRIVVEIDCYDRICGECRMRIGNTCDQFRKFLRPAKGADWQRCPACKRAEIKEAKK
jgi:hypothetical protein